VDAANPEDPNKGRFGGRSSQRGRRLSAAVSRIPDDRDWFRVILTVEAEVGAQPLTGTVTFHLHPTFPETTVPIPAVGNRARLELRAYGAFTVGAVTGDGTRIELDLAELPDAPMEFRMR
jgi:hypothetical protein